MPVTRQRSKAEAEDTPRRSVSSSSSPSKAGRPTRSSGTPFVGTVSEIGLRNYQRNVAIGLLISIIIIGSLSWAVLQDKINISGPKLPAQSDFGAKMRYTLRYQVLGLIWLAANLLIVSIKRVRTRAIDPTSGNDSLVQKSKNILTNSMEAFVMSAASQYILITYLTATMISKLIPLVNLLFFTGRIAFYFGYPHFRTVGFAMTYLPTFAAITYTTYQFGIHLGLYN